MPGQRDESRVGQDNLHAAFVPSVAGDHCSHRYFSQGAGKGR
jgi:hypothetical protein